MRLVCPARGPWGQTGWGSRPRTLLQSGSQTRGPSVGVAFRALPPIPADPPAIHHTHGPWSSRPTPGHTLHPWLHALRPRRNLSQQGFRIPGSSFWGQQRARGPPASASLPHREGKTGEGCLPGPRRKAARPVREAATAKLRPHARTCTTERGQSRGGGVHKVSEHNRLTASHLQPNSQLKPETLIHIKRSLEVRAEFHLLYKETVRN